MSFAAARRTVSLCEKVYLGSHTTIRDSTLDDAQQIFDLRCDPRLKTMQYPPSFLETPTTILAITQPGPEFPMNGWKCSTILTDGSFAGHIIQVFTPGVDGVTTILLGWDLVPECWGKGIMVRALDLLFEQRFTTKREISFVACCFASNLRCIRVIEKLGFQPDNLTFWERVSHFVRTRGRERVVKYCLTYDQWHNYRTPLLAEQIGEQALPKSRALES